ncbi:hypothetical protein CTAYLR_008805 [Chrysophaeum taylorii]|uniref:J domain-containing protein n=1 Tax=Chrysophaeum taylorii TaxID=2483200 RepID=A0AAD7UDX3_9STRA|nr:hypothetical protein CTAYLR_008805 [Chrysophaeum taylorii]
MDAYYDRLEVSPRASSDELKRAYKRLSLKLHPDKGGSEAEFKAMNEAYEVLKDEKKRAAYDRFGLDLGDDGNADDMAVEIGSHANRAMGVACIRTALTGAVVVAMRRRWIRGLGIAACGGAAVYGRLARQPTWERVAFRLVMMPLAAWLLSAIDLLVIFDVVVTAAALGLAELETRQKQAASLVAAAFLRWIFGARLLVYAKLIAAQLALLAIAHFFFLLVAALANQILEHKLEAAGKRVKAILKQADREIKDLKAQFARLQPATGPTRRAKHA